MRGIGSLVALIFLALPAICFSQPVASQEISVMDTAAPDASTFGIDSPRFPHVSFAGSDSRTITSIFDSIPVPLGPGVSQDILIALLMMPVYPDSISALPENWFQRRVDRLIRQGAYADALRLVGSLPDTLANEATVRRHVDLAFTIGDLDEACAQVGKHLANGATQVDAYWSLRQAFCQRNENKQEEAELTLAIYAEQYSGQQSVAYTLLSEWGKAESVLPPFTKSDAESVPLLIAAIKHGMASKAAERISASFINEKEVAALTPAFAVALAEREVFPLSLRLAMMDRAVASGAADPASLRVLLEKVTMKDAIASQYRSQGALIADMNATQSAENKVGAVYNAIVALKRAYTPYVARGMFGKELEAFGASPESFPLTAELALDAAAYFIERNNASRVSDMQRYLEQRGQSDESFKIVSIAIGSALYYNRQLSSEQAKEVIIPSLNTPQRAGAMWILRRLVMVQRAAGVEVPAATVALSQSAPLPNTHSVDSSLMLALEEAENNGRTGELVLRSLQLMGEGKLAYVSDDVFARCISALQKNQQPTYAAALAQAAILNPPTEALQAGGVAGKAYP